MLERGRYHQLLRRRLDTRLSAVMPGCSFALYATSIGVIDRCSDNYLPGAYRNLDMPDLAGRRCRSVVPDGVSIMVANGSVPGEKGPAGRQGCGRYQTVKGIPRPREQPSLPGNHQVWCII